MVAKRFFHICAGILCLAIAYHFGAMNATAQAPSNPVVGISVSSPFNGQWVTVTANGDHYYHDVYGNFGYAGNPFGGPTPATQPTWGQLKSRYRPGAAATPQDK